MRSGSRSSGRTSTCPPTSSRSPVRPVPTTGSGAKVPVPRVVSPAVGSSGCSTASTTRARTSRRRPSSRACSRCRRRVAAKNNNPLIGLTGYGKTTGLPYPAYIPGPADFAPFWMDPFQKSISPGVNTEVDHASWYLEGGRRYGIDAWPKKLPWFDESKAVYELTEYPARCRRRPQRPRARRGSARRPARPSRPQARPVRSSR